eukprot:scaffold5758_cov69-Skeletonema_marinoi.AAC.2
MPQIPSNAISCVVSLVTFDESLKQQANNQEPECTRDDTAASIKSSLSTDHRAYRTVVTPIAFRQTGYCTYCLPTEWQLAPFAFRQTGYCTHCLPTEWQLAPIACRQNGYCTLCLPTEWLLHPLLADRMAVSTLCLPTEWQLARFACRQNGS